MADIHLFPFELVGKGSKIIIYGAGNVGNEFLRQIWISKWCEVVMIADKGYKNIRCDYQPVCSPNDISAVKCYDYVVIAIESEKIVEEVELFLQKQGVEKEKVVTVVNRYARQVMGQYHVNEKNLEEPVKAAKIAFCPLGGLGDYIVSLKLFEKIVSIDSEIEIDVYGKKKLIEPIYSKKKNLNEIIDMGNNQLDYEKYDLVIFIDHHIQVKKINYQHFYGLSPLLANKFKELILTFEQYCVDVPLYHYRYAIFIKRALIKQLNRYTVLNHDCIFNIQDKKVEIEYDENYLEKFNALGLNSYITLNRGADDIFKDRRMQTKVWPKEYYLELIERFHEEYPDIEVVQLGAENADKLDGVSSYLLGQDFELVKYVLKNSLLHFDCEGGLVHLATQLGTKCAVVFGPTPVNYYGYEQNINIISESCNNCMGVTYDWYVNCYRGLEKQECMYSLSPEIIFKRIKDYLNSRNK